jgi:hypothetical protein
MSFPARFKDVDAARARFGGAIDALGHRLSRGDVLADRAVEALARLERGSAHAIIDAALAATPAELARGVAGGQTLPEPLVELVRTSRVAPPWLDRAAIDRGGELLFRTGFFGGVALGASLLYGYASPGGNKPLVFSGRLASQAQRRLNETSRFVQATCLPRGLHPGAPGFLITIKVRLMHAQVRRMILASGRWDQAAWGLPINQHDLAATSLLFSLVPVLSLRRVGFEFAPEEMHLFMQLWRYSSWLMGVEDDLLVGSEREAQHLADMIASTEGEPDADSRALARALLGTGPLAVARTPRERRRAQHLASFGHALVRKMMGDDLASALELPESRYRHFVRALGVLVSGMQRADFLKGQRRARAVEEGKRYWQIAATQGKAQHLFAMPESLLGVAA